MRDSVSTMGVSHVPRWGWITMLTLGPIALLMGAVVGYLVDEPAVVDPCNAACVTITVPPPPAMTVAPSIVATATPPPPTKTVVVPRTIIVTVTVTPTPTPAAPATTATSVPPTTDSAPPTTTGSGSILDGLFGQHDHHGQDG